MSLAVLLGLVLWTAPAVGEEGLDVAATGSDQAVPRTDVRGLLLSWGKYALESNRFSEAEERLRELLRLDWNDPRAYELLQETRARRTRTLARWVRAGEAAERSGNWALAISHYQRVLDESYDHGAASRGLKRARRRGNAEAHVRAGLEKFILGDYPGAELDFEQALAADPGDSRAVLFRELAGQQTTESSGLADLRSDQRIWEKYLNALKKLRAGDLDGAERSWREILEEYPGNGAVLSNLEQVQRRRGQEYSTREMGP